MRLTKFSLPLLFLAASLAHGQGTPPIALTAHVEALGRGLDGTVVGAVFQIAPEDRERTGDRVRVVTTLRSGERDRGPPERGRGHRGRRHGDALPRVGPGRLRTADRDRDARRQGRRRLVRRYRGSRVARALRGTRGRTDRRDRPRSHATQQGRGDVPAAAQPRRSRGCPARGRRPGKHGVGGVLQRRFEPRPAQPRAVDGLHPARGHPQTDSNLGDRLRRRRRVPRRRRSGSQQSHRDRSACRSCWRRNPPSGTACGKSPSPPAAARRSSRSSCTSTPTWSLAGPPARA